MATLQWAWLADGRLLMASDERAWIHAGTDVDDPAGPMQGPATPASTARLLDGAVALGQRAAHGGEPPALTPARWAWRLAGYHHTTTVTPGCMAAAADRFAAAGRCALAGWARAKAVEEDGHDVLARRDLEALGYDADAALAVLRPPTALALAARLRAAVAADDPIGCVGYAYALERLALARGADYIARVEAALPTGVRATRCLRVHSAVGSDVKHVRETIELVAGLTGPERAAVAVSAHETAVLCCAPPAGGHLDDESLGRLLHSLPPPRHLRPAAATAGGRP